ncbi:Putative UPF0481 protein At3g02645 [Linum perenne]
MSFNQDPTHNQRWIINIRRSLEEQDHIVEANHEQQEEEEEEEHPIRIFNVPKSLLSSHPYAYTPQQVAIGPYHHHRPELHEAARHKHSSARRLQKRLQPHVTFRYMVDQLTSLVPQIRDYYHKYLDFSDETLAWMMGIDGSLLLDLLARSGLKNNAMVRDVVMLENQIPMIVLRKILEVEFGSKEIGDDKLKEMLVGFCREVSPFMIMDDFVGIQVSRSAHLLDYLYATIVPHQAVNDETAVNDIAEEFNDSESSSNRGLVTLTSINKLTSKLNKDIFKTLFQSKPVKLMLRLPLTILSTVLPGFAILRHPVEHFLFSSPSHNKPEQSNSNKFNGLDRPPLLEEITIPSVTELVSSGIRIIPTTSSITDITFDAKASKLHLSTVRLDVNTEVVMRNLVAYECSNVEGQGALVFTRYTELMNGIVDTREDVEVLRERGVVLNHLKSDEEAANLWNGMSKSIRLTKVGFLDEVIREVNVYYNGRWKIKIGRFMRRYVFTSWQSLTLFAAVLILMLMAFQVLYSIYNWYRLLSMPRGVRRAM